jgi:hypothetical protein
MNRGWPKQFDMINFLPIACNPRRLQDLPDCPSQAGEHVHIVQSQLKALLCDKKKPVSTPGNVTIYCADTGYFHGHPCGFAIAGNIVDGHFSTLVQHSRDHIHGGFHTMFTRVNPASVRQTHYKSDSSMSAHAQITDVIKEDRSCRACAIDWFA